MPTDPPLGSRAIGPDSDLSHPALSGRRHRERGRPARAFCATSRSVSRFSVAAALALLIVLAVAPGAMHAVEMERVATLRVANPSFLLGLFGRASEFWPGVRFTEPPAEVRAAIALAPSLPNTEARLSIFMAPGVPAGDPDLAARLALPGIGKPARLGLLGLGFLETEEVRADLATIKGRFLARAFPPYTLYVSHTDDALLAALSPARLAASGIPDGKAADDPPGAPDSASAGTVPPAPFGRALDLSIALDRLVPDLLAGLERTDLTIEQRAFIREVLRPALAPFTRARATLDLARGSATAAVELEGVPPALRQGVPASPLFLPAGAALYYVDLDDQKLRAARMLGLAEGGASPLAGALRQELPGFEPVATGLGWMGSELFVAVYPGTAETGLPRFVAGLGIASDATLDVAIESLAPVLRKAGFPFAKAPRGSVALGVVTLPLPIGGGLFLTRAQRFAIVSSDEGLLADCVPIAKSPRLAAEARTQPARAALSAFGVLSIRELGGVLEALAAHPALKAALGPRETLALPALSTIRFAVRVMPASLDFSIDLSR